MLGDNAVVVPVAPTTKSVKKEYPVDDADEDFDETRSVDSDDAGSLEEFIVDDEHDGEQSEEEGSVDNEPPRTKEEERARELDGIDTHNIVLGKRTRRATQFYEQTVFNTAEYRRMMLDDVPADEMHALESSEGEESDDDDDDGAYEQDDESEEEEGSEEEGSEEVKGPANGGETKRSGTTPLKV